MVKDTAFYELFASYKVPNHEQVGYWVDLKSNPRGEVIRVYNNNTRSWTKITEALPDIVNGSAFKSKREDGTYRETGLYDDPGDVSNILLELFEVINSNNAVIKISQLLYDKIKNLAKEHGTSSTNSEVFIYDALTTTNLLSDVGGDCAIKIIYSKGEIHVYYNAYNAPYRTVEVVTLFDIDVNLHVKVQSIQNGVITEGIVSLLSSGDGTKYLNDAGEYETINEVYVGSVEPTGNEEIWINPDEDYNLSSIGLVEEAPLDNKLHARKNGQWVEFVENNTDLSSFATKTDLETKVDEAPTDDKQYARKNGQWSEVTEGVYVGDTEPTGNQNVWIDPSDDSIDINAIPEAPVDNKPYVRKDGEWVNMHDQYENEDIVILIMDMMTRESFTITQEEYNKFVAVCPVGEVAFASSYSLNNVTGGGGSNKGLFKIVNDDESIMIYINMDYAFYFGHQSFAIMINSNLSYEFTQAYGYVMPGTDTDTGERLLSLSSILASTNESFAADVTLISGGDGTKFLANSGQYSVPNNLQSAPKVYVKTDSGKYIEMRIPMGIVSFTPDPIVCFRPSADYTNAISLGTPKHLWKELHVTDIYAYGNIYSDGKLILNSDTFTTEDLLTYGVKWEVNGTNPVLTRIGSDNLHRTLPIQSKMRGCTLADDGTVNHYFNNNWTANTDGTPIIKDGSDGMVMIEIPEYYVKYEVVDGYNTIRLSEIALAGYTKVDKQYISAYEATVDRTDSTKPKLASVVNNSVEFRGGTNNAEWDSGENTLLGKPLTSTSRANFRTYARNRGNENEYYWNMYDFIAHNTLYTLYIVEYANLNSQLAVNNTLTSNGYKQGGLGTGVTNLNGSKWGTFNSYNSVVPCGHSDSLGNNSGEVAYTMPASYGTLTTYVNRYRGVENPFGHIWKNTDGIIFDIKTDAAGGTSTIYIATNPEKYKDSVDEGYTAIGELPRTEGYGKSLHLGTFFLSAVGGSSTTGLCDYFYTSISRSSLRTCLMGGCADNGAHAGFSSVTSNDSVGSTFETIGSRLIFRK